MKQTLLFILLIVNYVVFAQSYEEVALSIARTNISGTARTIGVGGAFGSVGADLGSISINPAGLGLYRSTDFSITPALMISANQADFNGGNTKASSSKIYFNQAGFAYTKILNSPSKANQISFNTGKLNAITFAINYQRQNMFNRTISFEGQNRFNSGISYYANVIANSGGIVTTDNYSPQVVLAVDAGLISFDSASGNYFSSIYSPIQQSGKTIIRGATDQVDIAVGGNINDKLYFGLGAGISILTYSYESAFTETDNIDTSQDFENYTSSSFLRTTGLGINAKFGLIYKPVSWLRIGASYQMPTFNSVTENYSVDLDAVYDSTFYQNSLTGFPLKYKFRTPMRGVLSASFFIKENGFFSVDYEIQNFGSSNYNFGKAYESFSTATNTSIKKYYTFNHTIRAGFEGAYKSFRARAGYSFSTSPYKKEFQVKSYSEVRQNISAGLGYRGNRFYADFAYLFGMLNDVTNPYADAVVKSKSNSHTMFVTIGFRLNKAQAQQAPATKKSKQPKMGF